MDIGYYQKLCALQRETIEKCLEFIHSQTHQKTLDDASAREWTLAARCSFLDKDNKALRELCEEYRAMLNDKAN